MDNKPVLNDQEIARREKLAKYEAAGLDPYGHAYKVTHHASDIRKLCKNKSAKSLERMHLTVSFAGRIMAIRRMGKASFMKLQDKTGHMQVYMGIDVVGAKQYELFKLADIGDIVGVKGFVMMTRTGELTIRCEKYTHLTKCLHPLPEKFHGLTDVEERYRRRYLDLIMNDEAKAVAFMRPRMVRSIQEYLDNQGYVEVETSMLSPILGGASARPFVTHHNALDKDFYLRIATEINLKKLLVGGLERVYEIGRLFRNEGMDSTHNPEFTTIEAYEAYGNLQSMRKLAEGMIRKAAKDVTGSALVTYQDKVIDFKSPFRWVSMAELIQEKTGIDFTAQMTFEEAKALADKHEIHLDKFKNTVGHVMNEFFEFTDTSELEKIDESGFGIFYNPKAEIKNYTMRFYDNIAYIVSLQVWHKNQSGRWIDDDTFELTVPATNDIELVSKVLSYGVKAEPIAPEEFVENYKNEIKTLKDKFGL